MRCERACSGWYAWVWCRTVTWSSFNLLPAKRWSARSPTGAGRAAGERAADIHVRRVARNGSRARIARNSIGRTAPRTACPRHRTRLHGWRHDASVPSPAGGSQLLGESRRGQQDSQRSRESEFREGHVSVRAAEVDQQRPAVRKVRRRFDERAVGCPRRGHRQINVERRVLLIAGTDAAGIAGAERRCREAEGAAVGGLGGTRRCPRTPAARRDGHPSQRRQGMQGTGRHPSRHPGERRRDDASTDPGRGGHLPSLIAARDVEGGLLVRVRGPWATTGGASRTVSLAGRNLPERVRLFPEHVRTEISKRFSLESTQR